MAASCALGAGSNSDSILGVSEDVKGTPSHPHPASRIRSLTASTISRMKIPFSIL